LNAANVSNGVLNVFFSDIRRRRVENLIFSTGTHILVELLGHQFSKVASMYEAANKLSGGRRRLKTSYDATLLERLLRASHIIRNIKDIPIQLGTRDIISKRRHSFQSGEN
jgi:hypothetical protein